MTSYTQFKRASEIDKIKYIEGLKCFDKEVLVA